jgi:hypothetical protein
MGTLRTERRRSSRRSSEEVVGAFFYRATSRKNGSWGTVAKMTSTFGRIFYYEKSVDINEIRSLYGHATTEMTLYYIGAVCDRMRAAVPRFNDPHPVHGFPVAGSP